MRLLEGHIPRTPTAYRFGRTLTNSTRELRTPRPRLVKLHYVESGVQPLDPALTEKYVNRKNTQEQVMDGQIIRLPVGASVLLVALRLCFVVARLSARALSGGQDRSVSLQGSMAVLASSIALFGVLITRVFFITAYSVDAGVRLKSPATSTSTEIRTATTSRRIRAIVHLRRHVVAPVRRLFLIFGHRRGSHPVECAHALRAIFDGWLRFHVRSPRIGH